MDDDTASFRSVSTIHLDDGHRNDSFASQGTTVRGDHSPASGFRKQKAHEVSQGSDHSFISMLNRMDQDIINDLWPSMTPPDSPLSRCRILRPPPARSDRARDPPEKPVAEYWTTRRCPSPMGSPITPVVCSLSSLSDMNLEEVPAAAIFNIAEEHVGRAEEEEREAPAEVTAAPVDEAVLQEVHESADEVVAERTAAELPSAVIFNIADEHAGHAEEEEQDAPTEVMAAPIDMAAVKEDEAADEEVAELMAAEALEDFRLRSSLPDSFRRPERQGDDYAETLWRELVGDTNAPAVRVSETILERLEPHDRIARETECINERISAWEKERRRAEREAINSKIAQAQQQGGRAAQSARAARRAAQVGDVKAFLRAKSARSQSAPRRSVHEPAQHARES